MSVVFGSILIDTNRETSGAWVKIPEWPGVELKVRGFNYTPFKTARDEASKDLFKKYKGEAPESVLMEVNGRLMAEHILLDWKGFFETTSPDSAPVPYTADRALETLTSPAGRLFQAQVSWAANTLGMANLEFVEEAAKK